MLAIINTGLIAAFDSPDLVYGGIIGIVLAIVGVVIRSKMKAASQRAEADSIVQDARREAETLLKAAEVDAKAEALKRQEEFAKETAIVRAEFKETEKRLSKREDSVDSKLDTLATKERNIEANEKKLAKREEEVSAKEARLDEALEREQAELVRISSMSVDEAKRRLLEIVKHDIENDAARLIDRTLTEAKEEADEKAREIIITAIQRSAAEHTSASTVSTVDIPSDEMKGRVIGREGRNIRAFEKATGVDVIVDDTPGVVIVSAFDPVRREVARRSLERLIQDGRIHPGRIEELVEETAKDVEKDVMAAGKAASVEANIGGLHKRQMELLGRLSYRTSYGQNVLRHSIEVAFLCQNMADELGLDGRLARRCGLLHDIGKAIDHEQEGGHPLVGYEFCKRYNEKPEVLNAIWGHHGDVEATSPYTPLVAAADAISASRPGGRRESLERYIKRLEQLESLATEQHGVRQAFAIQAGREVRVIVDAKKVDDARASKIAHDIAKRIEEEMTYPGEVRVTVLREIRAVGIAR
ncbi:MAG TPA: ribonuclease Y [Phycisphaerae bacterium]|nr:ribonuclease Y [Phycisphaerae bacterium]